MEKERIVGYNEKPIKENSKENYQVYHFKFEDDLNGLIIREMTIKSSVIPRIGETIEMTDSFIDSCLCFYNEDASYEDDDNERYGKEELDCFFPQREDETESDYKCRISNFINEHFYDANLKEDESYNTMQNYIIEIICCTSFEIVKIVRTLEENWLDSTSRQRVDIYLLGKFETEDFKWE